MSGQRGTARGRAADIGHSSSSVVANPGADTCLEHEDPYLSHYILVRYWLRLYCSFAGARVFTLCINAYALQPAAGGLPRPDEGGAQSTFSFCLSSPCQQTQGHLESAQIPSFA